MAFVNVDGEVSRVNRSGNGFGVKEVREFQGKERVTFWSVFPPKDAQVHVGVGDRVKVSGFLEAKVGDPKTGSDGVERRYVDLLVSQAKVEVTAAVPAPEVDAWASQAPVAWGGDNAPF